MKTVYQLSYLNTKVRVPKQILGIFNKIPQALTSMVKNNGTLLEHILSGDIRLFIEKFQIGEYRKTGRCFDSHDEKDMLMLKKIIFFEALEIWKSNLGCLTESPEEIGFDPEDIEEWDDVGDALALQFLADDNYVQFINENLVE